MNHETVLDSVLHKLPSTRKTYQVTLIVPDNGIPIIEYSQSNSSKKPKKSIQFLDLLFADKKHDTNDKFAFNVYTIDKTVTFRAHDESQMNEWLSKIREYHSNLYPEFKRYDSIFEANLLDRGLAKTMTIQGAYRLALCKESLDLIPLLTAANMALQQTVHNKASSTTTSTPNNSNNNNNNNSNNNNNNNNQGNVNNNHDAQLDIKLTNLNTLKHHHHSSPLNTQSTGTNTTITPLSGTNHHPLHHHLPHHLPNHQRFHKRHPLVSSKTIELSLRSIRRCGHTDNNFYIESGRRSQIGEGDLWMALTKKSTARQLHELLLATMKLASASDDIYKTPRSRSGSSSDNAHRTQQSRSSSLNCLNNNIAINNNNTSTDVVDEAGYLPMA